MIGGGGNDGIDILACEKIVIVRGGFRMMFLAGLQAARLVHVGDGDDRAPRGATLSTCSARRPMPTTPTPTRSFAPG